MLKAITGWLFNPTGLTPHAFCLAWEPWLIWLHALGNLGVAIAYTGIPIVGWMFLRTRRDMQYWPLYALTAAFIWFCGLTHWLNLLTLWVPAYGLSAVVMAATALISLFAFGTLLRSRREIMALPTPVQLQEARDTALRAERALNHKYRMESVGLLASGVAHDFRNAAAAALAGLELIRKKHGHVLSAEAQKILEEALGAVQRGAESAGRIVTYARPKDPGPFVATKAFFDSICQGPLQTTLAADAIRLVVRVEDGAPAMAADAGQLATVLVHLAANAREAMPKGGTLTLSAALDPLREGCVRIDVTDTGAGMDQEMVARVSKPFVTVQLPESRQGLGLAMAHGFIQQVGGRLSVASVPGLGTQISLWVPVAEPVADAPDR
jgi:signal transduction histidine kinase